MMYPSGATCLLADCCFSELALPIIKAQQGYYNVLIQIQIKTSISN